MRFCGKNSNLKNCKQLYHFFSSQIGHFSPRNISFLSVLELPFTAVNATKSMEECWSLCPSLPVPVCKSEELLCLLKSSCALVQFISAALLPFTPSDCADTAIDQGKEREGGRLRTGDALELIIPVFQLLQEWVAKCKVGKSREDKRGNKGTVLKSKREGASQRKAVRLWVIYPFSLTKVLWRS